MEAPDQRTHTPVRVLIAEDSATGQMLLRGIIESDPGLEVVGTAEHGREAVTMCAKLRPDLVLMDINMPHMDGFTATKHIMSDTPTPIVIITAISGDDVALSMEAMRCGALAILAKPTDPHDTNFRAMSRELTRTIHHMAQVKVVRRRRRRGSQAELEALNGESLAVSPLPCATGCCVVAIAASTGGPGALHQILSQLPADFDAPVLLVQHIAPAFDQGFGRWLDRITPLKVQVAEHNASLECGTLYVAPSDFHLGLVTQRRIALTQTPPDHGFRPSADALFRSVGQACGADAIGVILTGMGHDGTAGLRHLKSLGGHVIAQDESSPTVVGMPGPAIDAVVLVIIFPPPQIGARFRAVLARRASDI